VDIDFRQAWPWATVRDVHGGLRLPQIACQAQRNGVVLLPRLSKQVSVRRWRFFSEEPSGKKERRQNMNI
jgi:hypothetical protein